MFDEVKLEEERSLRFEGELLAAFSDIELRYEADAIEIALAGSRALLGRVAKHGDPAETLRYVRLMREIYSEQADAMEAVFQQARRAAAN